VGHGGSAGELSFVQHSSGVCGVCVSPEYVAGVVSGRLGPASEIVPEQGNLGARTWHGHGPFGGRPRVLLIEASGGVVGGLEEVDELGGPVGRPNGGEPEDDEVLTAPSHPEPLGR
jgi:hypothetical protein